MRETGTETDIKLRAKTDKRQRAKTVKKPKVGTDKQAKVGTDKKLRAHYAPDILLYSEKTLIGPEA